LTAYEANINGKDLKVTLKGLDGREVCFCGERLGKEYSIVLIVKASC